MTIHFTGGCACGTIRYEWSAEPVFAGNCHCRDCQRATGGTFAPLVFVPRSAGTITGDVKYRDTRGDSGHIVSRGFCPACWGAAVSKGRNDARPHGHHGGKSLMTQAGFNPQWRFSRPVHSRGIL